MAVNPMDYSGKDTVLDVVRTERQKFQDVINDPANWNVQTRCEEWEVRDMVGHMIDVTEGYLSGWERAHGGQDPVNAVGTAVMGQKLNEKAMALRGLSREEAIARWKTASDKMLDIFENLSADEWSNFLVGHYYMGPLPTFFYPAFHVMDYGVHTWDMHWGLGDKDAKLDERTAGVLVPYMLILYSATVEPTSAEGVDVVYGINVDGEWGGSWKVRVKDGKFESEATDDLDDAQAIFHYKHPSDFVLTAFQRDDLSEATGDPDVIRQVRGLFFTI
ncbi:MAG: maleylpyruvate isomerase family mycothiol-dependent enzyme [Chloroflexi bacterium]|nr:maleylpyruvate isomerase family mycothiol-dependent enzyme [Chloroflexota bacterium]